jgi:hypothetical protein
MKGFDPKTSFGDEISRDYDAVSRRGDEEETVAFLAGLAGDRDALELAVGTGRSYRLVYLVFNTIGNLLTQDDQVRCFENAARHLSEDGVFVLECRVPTAPARAGHQFIDVEQLELDHVELGVSRYDPVTQILDVNHVHLGVDGLVFSPIRLRLAFPPEFDLMARIAGLRLRDRWGGWNGEPFTAASWRHVSVYEPADI